MINTTILLVLTVVVSMASAAAMPPPFTRELRSGMTGADVLLAQNLLPRTSGIGKLKLTSTYDAATVAAVQQFQRMHFRPPSGVLDASAASTLLEENSNDNYRDPLMFPLPKPYKYKIHIPVHENRSIETTATLYAANGTVLHQYTVRTHGQDDAQTGLALNQFCGDGSTPTGLIEADLDSPEPDPHSYGKWPVNRLFKGVAGNALFCINNETTSVRNGILQHTGEWANWMPSDPMPNSHGCIHGHPADIELVFKLLVSLGVVVHKNPFNSIHYPFKGQGLFSIEQI